MNGKKRIFISSVQKELAAERRALKDYIQGDPFLGRFFAVFLFEDLPASGRRADEVYLKEVDRCDIDLGIFYNDYGYEDAEGVSPTEREFDRATAKERLVFIKGDDSSRHPKMLALARKAGNQVVRRRFSIIPELTSMVYSSLVEYLVGTGAIRTRPFDASACPDAAIGDLSRSKLRDFWNPGQLPPSLTPESLRAPHASIPHNPLIAEPLFLTRYVEKAGTGILDMITLCEAAKLPPPQFRQEVGQFIQTLWRPKRAVADQVGTKSGLSQDQVELLRNCLTDKSLIDLMAVVGRANRTKFRDQVLNPLLANGLIEMTIPDKPTSRLQRYRLTDKGRARVTDATRGDLP